MKTVCRSVAAGLRLVALLLVAVVPVAAQATKGPKAPKPPKASEAVGIAIEIEDGVGVPLDLVAGGRYYVNQIDMRASLGMSVDTGVSELAIHGDFADLPWYGIQQKDQEFGLLANGDGTFTRRRFYTGALWMELPSFYYVRQLNDRGIPVGQPLVLNVGINDRRLPTDDFFVRRMRAIQETADCASHADCSTATNFMAEALVEIRNARGKPQAFQLHPHAAALQVIWSLKPWQPYEIPVRQVRNPAYAYGFEMGIDALTPPRADGTYAPGTAITFRLSLYDGAGNRLHEDGELPRYEDVAFSQQPAGIAYYRAFFDPSTTWYRRKHRERMLMAQIIGPAHHIQPMRSIADLDLFFTPGSQVVATPARDGVFGEFTTIPEANDLFGGAFFPELGGWSAPVSDRFTFHIPADAAPGTYLVTAKGRRVYLGEDLPASVTVEIQVGQTARTVAHLQTGNCQSCHNNGGELSRVLHANDNRAACSGCHVPLGFELEGPIYVRTHFIHSRSDRFDAPLHRCSTCHLEQEQTQRVSKSACLSCHKSYPAWHEERFGPIESMYVGGGRESFVSCTDSCHQTHPGSGF